MSIPSQPDSRLARILNAFRISRDQSISEFHRQLALASYSSSRRTLGHSRRISMQALGLIAAKLAPKLDMSAEEFIAAIYNDNPSADPRIAEFLLPTAWPGTRRMIPMFADFLVRQMSAGPDIVWFGHYPPAWLFPLGGRRRPVWCASKASDARKLGRSLTIARRVHREFVEGVAPQRIFLPIFRSELEAMSSRQPPFDRFTDAQAAELRDETMKSEQILSAIIDDGNRSFPSDLLRRFNRLENVVLIGNRLLAKQFRGRVSWLVFIGEEGPEVRAHIDRHRHLVAELRHWITGDSMTDAVQKALGSFAS